MDAHPSPAGPEETLVVALARVLYPKIIVEVGVNEAATTVCLADVLVPGGIVYGLEINVLPKAREAIRRWGFEDRIVLIEGDSLHTVHQLPVGIDFAFIDGNHAYEYAKSDGGMVWSKMRSGGIMAFHDVNFPANDTLPGPGPYVREAHPDAIWTPHGQGLAIVQKQ